MRPNPDQHGIAIKVKKVKKKKEEEGKKERIVWSAAIGMPSFPRLPSISPRELSGDSGGGSRVNANH